jgi:deoxyadenosine/deoxycytidine kinase
MKCRLESLAGNSSNNNVEFRKLSSQIAQLQSNLRLQISQLAPESLNQFKQIQQMSSVITNYILQQITLDALMFGDMYRRYDSVEEAHLETFEWILSDQVGGVDPERHAARELFTSWLASGSGIFHICGKLGAGKSTLMKFFCEHNRIMELLKEWAGIEPSILI